MTKAMAFAVFVLLASCGQSQMGGFETTDLQARVVAPDGTPVGSARAWLVRSRGDSAPAIVIDSGLSDGTGLVRFAIPAEGRSGLGIDVRSSDSLGLVPMVFSSADTAQVTLRSAHMVSVPSDPRGAAVCYVPGSHFVSEVGPDGTTARLALPAGSWTLAIRRGSEVQVEPLLLRADTLISTVIDPKTMDTTARADVRVLAARIQAMSQEGLTLDVINAEPFAVDSLTARLYMDGVAADMADFAVRLDIAQHYSAQGFVTTAPVNSSRWSNVSPTLIDSTCPATSVCSWAVDLPLEGATIGTDERLRISFLFDKHTLSGDSLQYLQSRPTHDPFAGSDWSFRARTWADSSVAIAGMPDYGGVPNALDNVLPAVAPYIVLLRKRRLISGKAPSLGL